MGERNAGLSGSVSDQCFCTGDLAQFISFYENVKAQDIHQQVIEMDHLCHGGIYCAGAADLDL